MIRHVSLLTLTPDTTRAVVDSILAELRTLPEAIPAIRSFAVGADLGLADGNATIAVTADFDNVEDFALYRDDTDHQRILRESIAPRLSARTVAQFRLEL